MTNNQDKTSSGPATSTNQTMSSMDQNNYAMYENQQQKQQQVPGLPPSLAERLQRPLYPSLSQLNPVMSTSALDGRAQSLNNLDLSNISAVLEEIQATKARVLGKIDEESRINHFKQLLEERRPTLEGHNAALQQIQAQLQKQQQQFQQQQQHQQQQQQQHQQQQQQQQQQRQQGPDGNAPGSMSGSMPNMNLQPSLSQARAAGDVLYPQLPQQNVLSSTQEALAERRAAVAAAVANATAQVAHAPEPAAAAAAVAAATKKQTELQNMGIKPSSPPPADSRTPPPTLATLASMHVEPPPPYVSNPSLAGYRNFIPQHSYSAHIANLMSGLSSTLGTGLPGAAGGFPGLTSAAANPLASLSMPAAPQMPGMGQMQQAMAALNMPHGSSLASSVVNYANNMSALNAPTTQSAAQTTWHNPSEQENKTTCHGGTCPHGVAMVSVPTCPMPFPLHVHSLPSFCAGTWLPSPVVWMGAPPCCAGTTCHSATCCQQQQQPQQQQQQQQQQHQQQPQQQQQQLPQQQMQPPGAAVPGMFCRPNYTLPNLSGVMIPPPSRPQGYSLPPTMNNLPGAAAAARAAAPIGPPAVSQPPSQQVPAPEKPKVY